MSDYDSARDRDHEPWTLWNGYPVYTATLLVAIHVAMLVLWTVLFAFHQSGWVGIFAFSTVSVMHGWVWQPLTYVLVHPPGSVRDTLWFAVEMYMLWTFGRELERFFGRRGFLQLYVLLGLLAPALLLLLAWMGPLAIFGTSALHFALFMAFATVYPHAQMLFGISAKWIALILLAVVAIPDIADNNLPHLLIVGASAGAAYYFVRYQRGELVMPRFRLPRRKPKFRVLPRPAPPVQRVKILPPVSATMDDVDALLDKIARSGLSSLSPSERARLERASADLKKKPEPL